MPNPNRPAYTSTYQCIRSVVAKESIAGLYRGLSSPMAGVAVVNAIIFGVYGNVQKRMSNPDSLQSHFWAGTAAGMCQSVVTSPMELAKTRMQLQTTHSTGGPMFRGPLDCVRYIHRTEGVRGIFRGFGITAVRDVPGFATYFVTYELLMRQSATQSAFHTLMAGGFAGVFSWTLSLPFDVIKTRLQADGASKYAGMVDCVKQSYRSEGLSFMTKGLSSTLIRAFLMNSVCFYVVAFTIRMFDRTKIDMDIRVVEPIAMSQDALAEPFSSHRPIGRLLENDHRPSPFGLGHTLDYMSAMSDAIADNETVNMHNEHLQEDPEANYYSVGLESISHLEKIPHDEARMY